MPKRLIKRWLPDQDKLKEHKHLRLFGKLLLDANLWHLNRRSAAGAFAVGLFMAWIPLPCQMLLAAGGAILFRVNLPLSVALVWLSNPFTMPPLFYGAYLVGCQLLGHPAQHIDIQFTWEWLVSVFETLAPPLLLGSLVLALLSALMGYAFIRTFWRINTVRQWQKRKEARAC
ncbi:MULTISPECIES: DUF2062 domain-containing protein [Aeromonas]|uniref:DUF2062 domain-containing protein n=2 Tax=Aeromonas TaxID=642 RepID=A0AAW9YH56_9GAMM|nr:MULTISPECIES: DUF2062 domain-containing protein [Aeromonas]QIY86792.1 DUF2062 domain-containing protein [Aeromonas hydrophila]HCH54537.1 DUF2062 domain-containing protein [Aeromonas sp.]AVP93758.1 DUF2062 domain-containing protein [Aeromonas rivipollensis]MBS4698685.1 DUF2062 domain-containing protein [Aeromonas media]MDM5057541.1 DUF2062 domain-containing protein [Aeromonas rivipollensis]